MLNRGLVMMASHDFETVWNLRRDLIGNFDRMASMITVGKIGESGR